MKFNINGFLKHFILFLVMTLGFFLLYGLILGVPTTESAIIVLTLLSVSSVSIYFWVFKED